MTGVTSISLLLLASFSGAQLGLCVESGSSPEDVDEPIIDQYYNI